MTRAHQEARGPRPPAAWLLWCVALAACSLLIGCATEEGAQNRAQNTARHASQRAPLVVFAASSLTEAFVDLAHEYEAAHPEVVVRLNFAGSQVLRLQLEQGAQADVFASADESQFGALVAAQRISESAVFARNELALVVPRDNPAGITRFAQLPQATRIVVGTEHVPVGVYTRAMLERSRAELGDAFYAAVRARVASEETNVRLVRAKVELGEADAAVVYRTDALASERVRRVPIPEGINVQASYPIGTLADATHPHEAARFLAYVRSAAGQDTLTRHGFLTGLGGLE